VALLGNMHSVKQLPIASNSPFWTQLSDITFEIEKPTASYID